MKVKARIIMLATSIVWPHAALDKASVPRPHGQFCQGLPDIQDDDVTLSQFPPLICFD